VSYSLVYTDHFNDCVREYQQRDSRFLAELMQAVTDLARQPFQNPSLQTHPMKGVTGEKRFISYVGGSKGRRLIWSRFNRAIVLLLYGEHDVVERKAERLVIELDGVNGDGITITEIAADAREAAPSPARQQMEPGRLFMAWTDAELSEFGFEDHVVPVLRRLDTEDELLELDMDASSFELAFNLLAYQDPEGPSAERADADTQSEIAQKAEELRQEEVEAERRIAKTSSRKHFLPVSAEEFEQLIAAPVEDWMIFLHPDQAHLAKRSFSGPARVRGGAGTGKTVVGLHRAMHLARRYREPILFTTYVNNLPPVLESLFRRLVKAEQLPVQFASLHQVARSIVADADGDPRINLDAAKAAFASAHRRAIEPAGRVAELGLTRRYLRDEIDWIIKGRGLFSIDDYLALPRTGRGTPLDERARREVWRLFQSYTAELERRKVRDFADVLSRAHELVVLGRASRGYRSIIIDEAQDLTGTGLQLAHALSGGDRPDGLMVIGDTKQSVYPGGLSLQQLGIDVRGRSAVVRVNYRNTRAIAELGRLFVDDVEDDDDGAQPAREGEPPTVRRFESVDEHDTELVAAVAAAAERDDTTTGDLAVLVPTNAMVSQYASLISELGLSTQKLQQYDGQSNQHVKVGTYQRGKGLEFKRVFLPRVDVDGLHAEPRPGEDEATHGERLALRQRQLHVAITRARDAVWVGGVGKMFGPLADTRVPTGSDTPRDL